ncbi:hypothetical protein PHMEG_0007465 [Phytophthora megakarya]|uniref:Uncharacterized protein n=1 Tax=Phytophthora megakarya TaxID=4795 RepID=A0A225WL54_9STRA|nr:hypothetical protein PHMEG_0007465 [Phytophthora megakarya]
MREEQAIAGQGKMAIRGPEKEAGRDRREAAGVRPGMSSSGGDHRTTVVREDSGSRDGTSIEIEILDRDHRARSPIEALIAWPNDCIGSRPNKFPAIGNGKYIKEGARSPYLDHPKTWIDNQATRLRLKDPSVTEIDPNEVRQIGDLTGPISNPNTSTDRLNAEKILLDLVQEAGLVAGEFDPDVLFEMELGAIQPATQDHYESLKTLVGEQIQMPHLNYQTGSSHYASSTSEPDSDLPGAPQHMPLGPSGAKYLRSRANRPDQRPAGPSRTLEKPDRQEERHPGGGATPTTNSS